MSHLSCVFPQYWDNPGAFNQAGLEPTKLHLDRFLAIMSSIVQAAFGFSGIEIVSPPRLHPSTITDYQMVPILGRRVRILVYT